MDYFQHYIATIGRPSVNTNSPSDPDVCCIIQQTHKSTLETWRQCSFVGLLHTCWSHAVVGNFLWSLSYCWTLEYRKGEKSPLWYVWTSVCILTILFPSTFLLPLQLDPPKTKGLSSLLKYINVAWPSKQEREEKFAEKSELPKEPVHPPWKVLLNWCWPVQVQRKHVRLLHYCRLESATREEMGFTDR